jgi:deoxyribonuclease-4
VKHKFGVHASIAGGLHNALLIGKSLGCDCLQIFVKNQRQWEAPPLTAAQIEMWRQTWRENPCSPVVAHGTYLVNLASNDRVIRRRSIKEFAQGIQRCAALGVSGLITHPGSHNGDGETNGIRRVIAALREILGRTAACPTAVLLEVTAGQGSCLGYRFEHLAEMIEGAGGDGRLGLCLDTCHLHAAGYDLASQDGYDRMVGDLLRNVRIEQVRCIHVNDSVKGTGSRVDRHAHIGQGTIGREGFRRLLCDERFAGLPMILETPKEVEGDDRDYDAVNLAVLRGLARKRRTM